MCPTDHFQCQIHSRGRPAGDRKSIQNMEKRSKNKERSRIQPSVQCGTVMPRLIVYPPERTLSQRRKKQPKHTQIPCVSHQPLGNFQQRSARIQQSPSAGVIKGSAQSSLILRVCFLEGRSVVIRLRLRRGLCRLIHRLRIYSAGRAGSDGTEVCHGRGEGLGGVVWALHGPRVVIWLMGVQIRREPWDPRRRGLLWVEIWWNGKLIRERFHRGRLPY